MGELLAKYEEKPTEEATSTARAAPPKAAGSQAAREHTKPVTEAPPARNKALKRKRFVVLIYTASRIPSDSARSDEISGNDDKENTPDPSLDMPAPKKRAKPAGPASRAHPSTVLSPKSSNSRTLPRVSPAKPPGDQPAASRPASPLKPPLAASPAKGPSVVAAATESLARLAAGGGRPRAAKAPAGPAATAGTRKASKPAPEPKPAATRGKRAAAAPSAASARAAAAARKETRTVSNSTATSAASGVSTGTTIVRRAAGTASKASTAATGRRNAAAGSAAAEKKAPAKKQATTAAAKTKADTAPAPARRVLRKRA